MTAEILHLPARELTTPPVEHTITVRLSSVGAGFFLGEKPLSLIQAATIVCNMSDIIQRMARERSH